MRIPIRWSAHANSEPPYAIDPVFFERVDGDRSGINAKPRGGTRPSPLREQRPLYLGKFGTTEHADVVDRVAWTRAITRDAESLCFSWSYWQFSTSFGAYDTTTGTWDRSLLAALPDRK
ncbi:MAG TPA: hypothetical protein VGH13_20115 [Xanthobacteraceae bacterium]